MQASQGSPTAGTTRPVAPSAMASALQSSIGSSFLRTAFTCWSRQARLSSPGFTHSDWMRLARVPVNFTAALPKSFWHFPWAASASRSTASPFATSVCWSLLPCPSASAASTWFPGSQPAGSAAASLHFASAAAPPSFRMVALHLSRSFSCCFVHFLQSVARPARAFDSRSGISGTLTLAFAPISAAVTRRVITPWAVSETPSQPAAWSVSRQAPSGCCGPPRSIRSSAVTAPASG